MASPAVTPRGEAALVATRASMSPSSALMHMPERSWAPSRATGLQAAKAQPPAMPMPRAGQATAGGRVRRSSRATTSGASRLPAANARADPATHLVPCSSAARPTASRVGPDPSSITIPPKASRPFGGPLGSSRPPLRTARRPPARGSGAALATRAPPATSQVGSRQAP
ncbi:MAG: hypothetical protein ABW234_08890 [Actinomycetes bacterium]